MGMDIEAEIVEAHRTHREARRRRDTLIRLALKTGLTGYALAQRMRRDLGDREALAQTTIRKIAKNEADQ